MTLADLPPDDELEQKASRRRIIDPGDPVRLLGQNVDYTAGIVDSHLGTVWLFIDGTIREHPVEQCVLSPNYRPGKLSQSKRKALWDRVYHHMRPQIIVRCGGVCERCSDARVTEVHHKLKRQHPLANVPSHLAALCDPCHDHIHANPEESYAEGWLIHVEAEYAA